MGETITGETSGMEEHDQVHSRKVLEMVTVANEYCRFLEKAEEYETGDLLQFLQKIVPLVYLKSSLLPEVQVSDEDAIEHYVTEQQWEEMFNVLRVKFGPLDEFYYIDLQEPSHHDPVKGSMAECFTDTYQDLKDFLLLYQNPLRTFRENAVEECRKLFMTRYGFRMISAHTVIHTLLYKPDTEENSVF